MLVILLLVSNIFIFIFAPVDCDNNKLSSDTKKNHKIISRRIVVMESILIVLCMILLPQINVYMIIATMAMLLVGFTLIPYKLLLGGL
jgi:accessory gene regulator protein AgrB